LAFGRTAARIAKLGSGKRWDAISFKPRHPASGEEFRADAGLAITQSARDQLIRERIGREITMLKPCDPRRSDIPKKIRLSEQLRRK
jgi:hypothetical protein